MAAKKTGRPPAKDPRVPYMTVRLTAEERKLIEDAAGADESRPLPPATWCRLRLLEAARKEVKGGGKR